MGFNIQFKTNPEINPLCWLCEEENESFWLFLTQSPRLKTYRDDTFLDTPPQQDNWKFRQIMQFSAYPTIYNLMRFIQEGNEQPINELDFQCSNDRKSDSTIQELPKGQSET